MPYLKSGLGENAAKIYYEVHGDAHGTERVASSSEDPRPCVVMIMGFAASLNGWGPQIDDLLSPQDAHGQAPVRLLLVDNRGVGQSSSPLPKAAYRTSIMASDVLQIMEEVGWDRVHVVGHSMGAMIACKLAAAVPEKIVSLTLISVTGGGWQSVPRSFKAIKLAVVGMRAHTPEDRAKVDLRFHFTDKTLNEVDKKWGRTRHSLLHEEYVEGSKGGGIGQPQHGFMGQLAAIWHHSLSDAECECIENAAFPALVIHGRHDILAMPHFGERLAQRLSFSSSVRSLTVKGVFVVCRNRLGCSCIMLEGAHFVCRERGVEVNLLLHQMIFHLPDINRNPLRFLDRRSAITQPFINPALAEAALATCIQAEPASTYPTFHPSLGHSRISTNNGIEFGKDDPGL